MKTETNIFFRNEIDSDAPASEFDIRINEFVNGRTLRLTEDGSEIVLFTDLAHLQKLSAALVSYLAFVESQGEHKMSYSDTDEHRKPRVFNTGVSRGGNDEPFPAVRSTVALISDIEAALI